MKYKYEGIGKNKKIKAERMKPIPLMRPLSDGAEHEIRRIGIIRRGIQKNNANIEDVPCSKMCCLGHPERK